MFSQQGLNEFGLSAAIEYLILPSPTFSFLRKQPPVRENKAEAIVLAAISKESDDSIIFLLDLVL